jgi:ribonuclease HII
LIPQATLDKKAIIAAHIQPDVILGIDEVGYGAWAGPLMVGGVIVPHAWEHPEIKDSKSISERKREKAFKVFQGTGYPYVVMQCSSSVVDRMGAKQALMSLNMAAARELSELLPTGARFVLVMDGVDQAADHIAVTGIMQGVVIAAAKADAAFAAVSAASIVAKVTRDAWMREYHMCYPYYDWESNKGYGSKKHVAALEQYGPCDLHRASYKPIQRFYGSRIASGSQRSS